MGNIAANTAFTITMAIKNLQAGYVKSTVLEQLDLDFSRSNFVNAQANYYSAPQQLNPQNIIMGHSHFVIEQLESMSQTTPLGSYYEALLALSPH